MRHKKFYPLVLFGFLFGALLLYRYLPSLFETFFISSYHYYFFLFALAFIMIILAKFLFGFSLSSFGFTAFVSFRHLAYGLSGFFFLAFFGRIIAPSFDEAFFQATHLADSFFPYFVLVLLAVVAEEVFYRGFLQSLLQQYYPLMWIVLPLALHFSLQHLGWAKTVGMFNNLVQVGLIFFAVILLGIIFYQTKQLLTVFLLHAIANGLNLLQIYLRFTTSYEWVLWLVWGFFSLAFLPQTWRWLKTTYKQEKRTKHYALKWWEIGCLFLFSFFPLVFFLF